MVIYFLQQVLRNEMKKVVGKRMKVPDQVRSLALYLGTMVIISRANMMTIICPSQSEEALRNRLSDLLQNRVIVIVLVERCLNRLLFRWEKGSS